MKSSPARSPAPRTTDKLPTLVPGLDTLLNGGIPTGRATLVVGRSGTFKTILSLQVAINSARHDVRALFISTEQETEDLLKVGTSLGLNVRELVESGRLRLLDLTVSADDPIRVSGSYDVSGLLYRINALVQESSARLVVLDSVSALFSLLPTGTSVRAEFFQLVRALRRMGVTVILTTEGESDYAPLTRLGVEDHVCDLVLVLRNVIDGKRRRRSIEIHKYRTSSHYKGEYLWTLGEGGLNVFPVDVGGQAEAGEDRYSSGLEGLDEMTGGGWMRDSIVLARGLSGSGKTTLGGMFALAGAQRGEKVVYYGFEETQPILLRNFQSIGLPLERYVRKGNLKIVCRFPEATSPDDMIIEVREMLEKYAPTLLVLDSLSSIEHVASAEGFRHFLLGLITSLRRYGRSALLLQTVGLHEMELAPYLSTLADAIVLLGYHPRPEGLERRIQLLKMRGGAHDTREHMLEIGRGGLKVGPPSA